MGAGLLNQAEDVPPNRSQPRLVPFDSASKLVRVQAPNVWVWCLFVRSDGCHFSLLCGRLGV
jgi:hypothetical protein